jgi:hypothetical protein
MLPTTEDQTAATAFARLNGEATSVLAVARFAKASLLAPVAVTRVLEFHARLRAARILFSQSRGNPALVSYARNILANAGYDLDGSLLATMTAIDNIGAWIEANVPQDGSAGVVTVRFGAGSAQNLVTMETTATAPLIPLINSLIASITT